MLHAALLHECIGELHKNCDYSRVEIRDECPTRSHVDWEFYGEELYKAKALVFAGAKGASISRMHELLQGITDPHFSLGFECPQAALATFFSLAEKLANSGRLRRAQALLIMGFVFARDKGFYDCSPWPVNGWDMLLAGRFVNERVLQLDAASIVQGVPKDLSLFEKDAVAIVSVCAYGDDQPIKALSRENHRLYAELHGYQLYHFESQDDLSHVHNMRAEDRNAFFLKVLAVRSVIERHKWVMWMDCDAFFMDPERSIDSVIHMYTYNSTVPLMPSASSSVQVSGFRNRLTDSVVDIDLLITVDSTGINNGVWMMRNSSWSVDFLHRWWNSTILEGMGATHNCSDQSTMQHELLYKNMMNGLSDETGEAWDSLEAPIWPREVRVVPQEHMQSFHRETAQAVVSREWVNGDFIKHHPGCHYYKVPCQHRFHDAHLIFLEKLRALIGSD